MIADPGERQIGERHVVLGQLVEGDRVARRLDRALAGQHHALGRAGGAGGVENDGRIGAFAGGDLGVEPGADFRIGERLAPLRDDVVDRMQVAVVVVAQAAPLVVDHLLELGQAIHDRHDLVDLLLVLDRGEAHLGVRQHEGEFVGHRVGIDRHRHRAEHLRRHHRPIELRPVGADDGDGLAALEAEPVQADRIGAHDLERLAPGPSLPNAEILVPHRRPIAVQDWRYESIAWGTYPPERRRWSPQPILPAGRAHEWRSHLTPRRLHGRSCCHDMKTPPQAGQALGLSVFGRSGG